MHTTEDRPSIGINSSVRLGGDLAILIFGLISAVVTARVLGPTEKGTLSTLLYVQMLLSYGASLGMADSAIVLVGRGRVDRQQFLATALPLVLVSGLSGGALLFLLSRFVDWSAIEGPVKLASILVPIVVLTQVLNGVQDAAEKIRFTTLVSVAIAGTTVLATWVLLIVFRLGIVGGILAALLGSTAGVVLLLSALKREGLLGGFSFDKVLLRDVMRVGVVAQTGTLLLALSQRADLLMVYGLAGETAAGHYTVALTWAQLALYAPFALIASSFPRLSRGGESDAASLLARASRLGLAAGTVASLSLVVVIPVAVPLLFGSPFRASIGAALIMLPGAIIWSEQWLLCKTALARGQGRLYFRSLACSLIAMLVGDVLLIPQWGIIGAAVASALAPLAGILAVKSILHQMNLTWMELLPRWADFAELSNQARQIARSFRATSGL